LVTFFLSKNGPHVSYKKNKWLSLCNVQLQRRIGTASGLCLDVFKVELTADAPPHTVHDSCQACSTGAGGETIGVTPEQRGDHAPRASRSWGNTLQGRLSEKSKKRATWCNTCFIQCAATCHPSKVSTRDQKKIMPARIHLDTHR